VNNSTVLEVPAATCDAEALPEGDVLRTSVDVFLIHVEGFTSLSPSTRERSV